jgi:hypothetical protein
MAQLFIKLPATEWRWRIITDFCWNPRQPKWMSTEHDTYSRFASGNRLVGVEICYQRFADRDYWLATISGA